MAYRTTHRRRTSPAQKCAACKRTVSLRVRDAGRDLCMACYRNGGRPVPHRYQGQLPHEVFR